MKLLAIPRRWLLALLLARRAARPAAAQTVDEIVSRGTINIGVLVDLPPYGHARTTSRSPTATTSRWRKLLGKYLGVKVNLVQLTSPNRIPFLVTNKVDLIVATFGVTPERAKTVLFSIPYSAIENVVFAPKDKTITTIAGPQGPARRRAARHGAGRDPEQDARQRRQDVALRRRSQHLSGAAHRPGRRDRGDRADGRRILRGEPGPGNIERKFILLQQPNGITMRKDQWNLHQWVNTFVYFTKNNGELNALYEKWFHKPLPNLPYL